jgi:hypothetical protein
VSAPRRLSQASTAHLDKLKHVPPNQETPESRSRQEDFIELVSDSQFSDGRELHLEGRFFSQLTVHVNKAVAVIHNSVHRGKADAGTVTCSLVV